MANSAGICVSFKSEILTKVHNLNSDSLKAALFLTAASPSITPSSATTYGAISSQELSSSGYTAGGVAVSNGTVATSGTVAYWTPTANWSWTAITASTPGIDCAVIYNTTASNKCVAVFTFGAQTITAGNFTLTMPTNDSTNALVRLN